jgi:lipoprotein LprG
MFCRRTALVVLLVLGLLTGCATSPDTSGPLPDGSGLVRASAVAVQTLRSVTFTFGSSGALPGLDIRGVDGQATLDGGPEGFARGHADVQETTNRFKYDYQLSGGTVYLTDQHGKRQRVPAAPEYTPAALLGPAGGLYRVLTGATQLKTERKERLDDVVAYRVTGKVPQHVIAGVVPAVQSDVDVKFWVSQADSRDLVRVWMQIPARLAGEGAVMLELSLSEPNRPVSVTPPPSG